MSTGGKHFMGEQKRGAADEPLEPLISVVRGRRVILDWDLARLYDVSTKALNQAIKRNGERFPEDFAFQLSIAEAAAFKLKKPIDSIEEKGNRSQFVTSSQRHRDPRLPPWAHEHIRDPCFRAIAGRGSSQCSNP
jgi:hypothetical protein